jgi:hypothetical protein
MAINFNIVFRMDSTRKQREGDIVVATPGGKSYISYAASDNTTTSGAAHPILPTGKSFVDANNNWGTSGQIAAYPTFYLGNNSNIPVAGASIGSGGTTTA